MEDHPLKCEILLLLDGKPHPVFKRKEVTSAWDTTQPDTIIHTGVWDITEDCEAPTSLQFFIEGRLVNVSALPRSSKLHKYTPLGPHKQLRCNTLTIPFPQRITWIGS
jgi:hypothetical protein